MTATALRRALELDEGTICSVSIFFLDGLLKNSCLWTACLRLGAFEIDPRNKCKQNGD
jgi:hypothetical protein